MRKIVMYILIAGIFIAASEKRTAALLEPVFITLLDTNVYGNVQVTKVLQDNGKGRYYEAMITANFKNYIDSGNVPVSSIKYDSIQLKLKPEFGGAYFDTSGRQPFAGKTWEVNGIGIIPSFTYTPTNSAPDYKGFANLPASAILGADLIIPLSEITNATNVSIQVSDGMNVINQDIYLNTSSVSKGMYLPDANSNITFSSNSLGKLTGTENGFLQVIVTNVDIREFDGKKIAFTNMFLYRKTNFKIE